jgi:hypothetical protein
MISSFGSDLIILAGFVHFKPGYFFITTSSFYSYFFYNEVQKKFQINLECENMKYISATIMYLSVGVCLGAGFGNKINEIDSTILLWVVLIGGPSLISLIIYFIENAAFPEMKFKLIHAILCMCSATVLSYFFIITKSEYTLLIVFSSLPVAAFFAFLLILSKYLEGEKNTIENFKMGNFNELSGREKGKGASAKMLSGVQQIKDYSESKK